MAYVNKLGGNRIFTAVEKAFGYCADNHTTFDEIAATGVPHVLPVDTWEDDDIAFDKGALHAGESPSIVSLDTAEELIAAYSSLCQIVGTTPNSNYIDKAVEHENDHAKRAARVGFSAVRFNMAFYFNDAEDLCWRPFTDAEDPTKPITRIELASVVAAPEELSDQDENMLASLGYDLFTLALRTQSYNYINDTAIPLPPAVAQHPLFIESTPYDEQKQ